MIRKIAFLCVNPWESFLPSFSRGNAQDHYQWICQEAVQRKTGPCCMQIIEHYGEDLWEEKRQIFPEDGKKLQLLYVRSHRKDLLKEVYHAADLVFVSMPGSRKECDRIFLSVYPWKEQSYFLWDNRYVPGDGFFTRIQKEYQLKEEQIVESKRLPHFLRELW